MIDVRFILGCIGLSAIVTYVWWCRLRVWLLRQDLFAIRDALWDDMLAKGLLDDPSHRAFRNEVNALIRIAPRLSVVLVLRAFFEQEDKTAGAIREQPARALPEVAKARDQVLDLATRYVLFESATGLIVTAFAILFIGLGIFSRTIVRRVGSLFDSHMFQELDRRLAPVLRDQLKTA